MLQQVSNKSPILFVLLLIVVVLFKNEYLETYHSRDLSIEVSIHVTMPYQPSVNDQTQPVPAKRMRIGTKSCAECRRRKIRCIYPPNSSACQECTLHETPCREQQPKRSDRSQNEGQEKIQQRLDELERMVRRVCEAVTQNTESPNLSQLKTQATNAITQLRSDAISLPKVCGSLSNTSTQVGSGNWSSNGSVSTPPTDVELFEEDAPLLQLFKQAMTVQWDNSPTARGRGILSGDSLVASCVAALKCLMPNHIDITLILDMTEHLWPIWPWQPSTQGASSTHQSRPVDMARDWIFETLGGNKPAVTATAILWLALCIQQLPRAFERQCPKLPASPKILITSYLSGAENLLIIDGNLGASIESLEATTLLVKLYVNMGKPRKAWAVARHGINQALLLGLHHFDEGLDQRKSRIWSFLWQYDRLMSLILGFPYAIPESYPSLLIEPTSNSISRIAHKLSVICGRIVERNYNNRNVDYFVTLRIDQQLAECRREMPLQWWETPSSDMPLALLYTQQTIKITYFQLLKYLHLPYMLTPTPESSYVNSRLSAVEASREMVTAYQTLRRHIDPMVIMCDLMDFQVFSAILIIIIDLLSHESSSTLEDQTRDWELVSYTTAILKNVSQIMECAVAGQAARLLQYILQAHDGLYSGPQSYEAIIPYFGKVRISRPQHNVEPVAVTGGSTLLSDTSSGTAQPPDSLPNLTYTFPPEIQFCTDPFVAFTAGPAADVFSDPELNDDWTTAFDGNNGYEFNQVYNMLGPYDI